MTEDVSSVVLRGRAIDVPIRGVDPQTVETVGIMFDCNVLADLEESYAQGVTGTERDDEGQPVLGPDGQPVRRTMYGTEAWQSNMIEQPFSTLRRTMAFALGLPERETGARMMQEHLPDYLVAIGTAFAIANGVDPTDALTQAETLMANQRDQLASAAAASSPIPGNSGSEPGSTPADPLTSSGD